MLLYLPISLSKYLQASLPDGHTEQETLAVRKGLPGKGLGFYLFVPIRLGQDQGLGGESFRVSGSCSNSETAVRRWMRDLINVQEPLYTTKSRTI